MQPIHNKRVTYFVAMEGLIDDHNQSHLYEFLMKFNVFI
jgi:hypothetical protein